MAEQAGIYKINLYENKGLNLIYNDDGYIESITTTGQTISLTNCQEIKMDVEQVRNKNNKLSFIYNLEYFIFDLTFDKIDEILNLKSSIYGWMPELYFYNNNRKFVNEPLKYNNSELPNTSNSFTIKLFNVVPTTERFQNSVDKSGEGIGFWVIEDDFIVQ